MPTSRLHELRAERDLTLSELASRAGLSLTGVHGIESGRRLGRWSSLARIARALETDIAELLPTEDAR